MRIEQVEEENMNKLLKERNGKMKDLEVLKKTPIEKMWLSEIVELENYFKKYKNYYQSKNYFEKINSFEELICHELYSWIV